MKNNAEDLRIMQIAQTLRLGRIVYEDGHLCDSAFYTDSTFRTQELLSFADAMQKEGYAEGRKDEREEVKPLLQVVELLLDAGHMNQELLAQLRAEWERL